jgi:hypothetical protein
VFNTLTVGVEHKGNLGGVEFGGHYRDEDIDHSGAPELHVNSDANPLEAKDRRCGRGTAETALEFEFR